MTSWLGDVVTWEDVKDIPSNDWELLYLNHAKMETAESLVVVAKWERFLFCKEHIFNNLIFFNESPSSGQNTLQWPVVMTFMVNFVARYYCTMVFYFADFSLSLTQG